MGVGRAETLVPQPGSGPGAGTVTSRGRKDLEVIGDANREAGEHPGCQVGQANPLLCVSVCV